MKKTQAFAYHILPIILSFVLTGSGLNLIMGHLEAESNQRSQGDLNMLTPDYDLGELLGPMALVDTQSQHMNVVK